MTKANKLLHKLVEEGAVLELNTKGEIPLVFYLGFANIVGKELVWLNMFPEGDESKHGLEFDSLEIFYDRDIAFYKGGKILAYVCPYQESSFVDHNRFREAIAIWNASDQKKKVWKLLKELDDELTKGAER